MKKHENLLTVYGARVSKSGKYLTLTLIEGEGDDKTFYNACIKLDKTAKTYAVVKGEKASIVINLLKEDKNGEIPF